MPTGKDKIWVVVPAFNEGPVIGSVVAELLSTPYRVVFVDDASTDDTAEILSQSNVDVCSHVVNLGQGAALGTGIAYALKKGADYIVTFDSDGQHRVGDIASLLEPLQSGRCGVVLGSRFAAGGEASNMPWLRRVMLRLATWYSRASTGMKLSDTHNGLRAFSREAACRVTICQNGMSHASEILSEIHRHKIRYAEVPVTIRYTDYSLQKGQSMANAFNILWDSLMGLFRR